MNETVQSLMTMNGTANHLIIAPILIPLIAGAMMLFYDETSRRAKLILGLASCLALLWVAVELLRRAEGSELTGGNNIGFYLLGDWPVPYGILLVIDRLSATMLVLTAVLSIPALIFAAAGWHNKGQHFHSLFQFLLMGLNGAFLTGDLFNLFVFFEILLAASYGLLLHGSGQFRVRTGLHYIAINLTASLLFLLGIALVYGVAGTLNMADLARTVGRLPDSDRALLELGAAFLGVAFLVKAAMYPFGFWLASAYHSAAPPVGAIFALMTKVGVYAVLRLGTLAFGTIAGLSEGFGAGFITWGGLATIIFGTLGLLASQGIGRMAGYLVLISSGTLLAAVGLTLDGAPVSLLSSALFYMIASTIGTSALFLLMDPMQRDDGGIAALLALTADAYGTENPEDNSPEAEVGLSVPGALAVLGISFALIVLLLAGLPPLPGFIGKLGMIAAAVGNTNVGIANWVFVGALIIAGLATLIALGRIGIQTFWATDGAPPRLLALEIAPVVALIAISLFMGIKAEQAMRYFDQTARAMLRPEIYIGGVFAAPRVADEEGRAHETEAHPTPDTPLPAIGSAPAGSDEAGAAPAPVEAAPTDAQEAPATPETNGASSGSARGGGTYGPEPAPAPDAANAAPAGAEGTGAPASGQTSPTDGAPAAEAGQ